NNVSGSWAPKTTLAAGATNMAQGLVSSIVIDGSNKVHLVHLDYQRKLNYLNNVSGSFSGGQINGNLTGGMDIESLRMNAGGDMALFYNSAGTFSDPDVAKYAYLLSGSGSTWTTGTAYNPGGSDYDMLNFFSASFTDDKKIAGLYDYLLPDPNTYCDAAHPR